MAKFSSVQKNKKEKTPNLFSFLKKFRRGIVVVVILAMMLNILTLLLPKINSLAIDSLATFSYDKNDYAKLFGGVVVAIFIVGVLQTLLSNYVTENIAAELRSQIVKKLSVQSFEYINKVTNAKLLTNLTSDVDAVKTFISQGLVIAFAAVVQLFGSAVLLLTINWQLALPIILTIPVLLFSFIIIFKRIEKYFTKAQEAIDKLNRVISESIVGAQLVRVLNSVKVEKNKFTKVNEETKFIGIKIINGFAALVPIINTVLNIAYLIVLGYGGVQVIDGTLSTGNFAAFFSYIFTFITPVLLLGFLGSSVGRAFATYQRIAAVINSKEQKSTGTTVKAIEGKISLESVSLNYKNKSILNNVSLNVQSGSRVGIIGPTAAGKTQLFYIITGLIKPNAGSIKIDEVKLEDYNLDSLYSQIGMVFQDSIIFNSTIRENIAFRNAEIPEEQIWKAIKTSEFFDFVNALPQKLDTVISERGASLSGGQKQRLTLARALALNPKILLLDDFTARVDIQTEKRIFKNLEQNYPNTTLVVVTQKINSVKDFDEIILLMEGEIVAKGNHENLLAKSFEYKQIFNSQRSTQ